MSFRFYLACLLIVAPRLSGADAPAPMPTSPPAAATTADEDDDSQPAVKPDPAATKFWMAITLLGHKSTSDQASGRTLLQSAADLEYTHAQTLLADCYLSGSYGFPKDPRKATNLLRLAAERGNAFAMVSLGSCYITGTGVRKDEEKAVAWLTAALAPNANFSRPTPPADYAGPENDVTVAGTIQVDPIDSSKATAHYLLGQILTKQKKLPEAQEHYVAAATAGADGRAGIYPAAVAAALNYALGQGVPRDQAKASEMLDHSRKLTARLGITLVRNYVALKMVDEFAVADIEESIEQAGMGYQSAVQLQIAAVFADKKSKEYNLTEAVKWYEFAANNDQAWAMVQLGLIYSRGDLGKPDPEKAFRWFEKAGGGGKPKHFLGIANLAICYQNGLGTPRGSDQAAALFKKYREHDIVCYLGSIGQCPTAPLSMDEEVKLNETWAKQKNDATAQYLLSRRYAFGWGVKLDVDEASRWLNKATKAKQGTALNTAGLIAEDTGIALRRIGLAYEPNFKKAVDYYREGSEVGNADATCNYARMLCQGIGVAQDTTKAEALYLKSLQIEPENATAHNNLGDLYTDKLIAIVDTLNGAQIQEYRAGMLKHLEEAVRLQHALAARNLGNIYYVGKVVPRDYPKAYGYYQQATEWGDAMSHFALGQMHERGQGVAVAPTEAAYHYRLAALEGNVEALRRLINFYLNGQGASVDLDRAQFWLQRMVQMGQIGVLTTVADIMLKKGDYDAAVKLLKQLAEFQNNTIAGFAFERLSYCYENGFGVKANPARAKKYQKMAVEKGDGTALATLAMQQLKQGKTAEGLATMNRAAGTSSSATFFLGQMYYFGTNVEKNPAKAIELIRDAATRNNADALYFLAVMAYNREPHAPNLDEAIRFAQQAENFGLTKATDLRERLERRRKSANPSSEEKTGVRSS